ncbi:host-nuclease inhibitor Gam family protein [Neisseria weaveri]|uniref:host-nuclease inhibitor Gam family protein n=1 Tax=Neisseria weaveri TaxID=28091 RepID=UPI0007C9D108|nr:host-nuclease inhibitor Gam family protein [Neisseria weaveri]SAY51581.1 host-nuclease inhibitor phage protein Gam [Neisseria weaveri]
MNAAAFDINAAMKQYGALSRKLDKAVVKLAEKTAALKAKHHEATAADAAALQDLESKIKAYAESHKSELTGGKGQAAKIGTGCIKWRKGRPSVKVTGDIEDVIKSIKRRRLSRWIYCREEINKTAILQELDTLQAKPIDGLEIIPAGETINIELGV